MLTHCHLPQSQYRLCVLGEGGVGKSALTVQFVSQRFVSNIDPTIEDAYAKQFQVEGQAVLLDILDTAGQEELRAMREQYMRAGQGFLLVYSLADRQSFLALADTYRQLSRVKDLAGGSMPVVVVASKCDIDPDERQVSEAEGRTFARSIGCPFIETSAKLRLNVDSAFELLLKRIFFLETRRHLIASKPKRPGFLSMVKSMASCLHTPLMLRQR